MKAVVVPCMSRVVLMISAVETNFVVRTEVEHGLEEVCTVLIWRVHVVILKVDFGFALQDCLKLNADAVAELSISTPLARIVHRL